MFASILYTDPKNGLYYLVSTEHLSYSSTNKHHCSYSEVCLAFQTLIKICNNTD
jgi:hypothetical protein